MQLTQLEIKGFKSFGDKVTINFNQGITSIVGPNGCGKSNVVDAIRWVLGEQSTKMLRSEKMENIIFNGTKVRKPSNLAEVSLTFSNSKNILPTEFSQVTITRKLYRSGESEYRLNDVQCRLKDITDLFLDTGIGADSYSIIELKMIDEIINNKENSRRALFEEASGISKYKLRKKQTFNKLKDTENDLTRVNDLLLEIEKNLKTLENQAKKAERYYHIRDEYKQTSIQLSAIKIVDFQKDFDTLEAQEIELSTLKTELLAQIASFEAQLQKQKLDVLGQEKNLSMQQKSTNEFITKIKTYEGEKRLRNEQLRFLTEKETRISTELDKDRQQFNHVLYNIKRLGEETLEENQKLDSLEIQVKQIEEDLANSRLEQSTQKQQLDTLIEQEQEQQNSVYQLEKEIDILKIQQEALEQEGMRNVEDSSSKELELTEFDKKYQEVAGLFVQKETQLKNLVTQEEELNTQVETIRDGIQKNKEQLNKENRSIDAQQNEYNLTKSLVDNLEGFPESIRFLKKNSNWTKNALLFSDILFCEAEYRVAIENYLEPYMNHYVVQNYKEAIQAINLLSDATQGRANFFILDEFQKLDLPPQEGNNYPELKLALSVTQVDVKYAKLCQYLLHQVYIVEQHEEGTFNTENLDANIALLSKNGKFIKTRSTMSGGSVGLFEGKRIGRAKNLEILAQSIQELEVSITALKASIEGDAQKLTQLRELSKKSEIVTLKQQIQMLENEMISVKTRQEQYESFLENSRNRKQDIENKIRNIKEGLLQAHPLYLLKKGDYSTTQQVLSQQKIQYDTIADLVLQKSSIFNQENIKLHQQKSKIESLSKDLEYRQTQQKILEERIESNEVALKLTKEEIAQTLHHVDFNDEGLVAMYQEKENLELALKEMEEQYAELRNLAYQNESHISELRKQKEVKEQQVEQIKDKKNNLKIELNGLKERLSVEFSFDIKELFDADSSWSSNSTEDELKQRTERLKKQLDEYGGINPMAMEAYQEMSQRYVFINQQKDDLMTAKDSLLKTIKEIDNSAQEQFMIAFTSVRENFVRVFRTLFNEEDSCDLILTNPQQPLESDIDIIARPKGKRPLSINQLSGGEKTLTATAILFSLYLLKPAPFCIFDEVDAPLDDTNIDKFNNIIREFSRDSQFIVVSHNKRTIASTDIIYGVTMVEQGVSRVVSVDLRNIETAA